VAAFWGLKKIKMAAIAMVTKVQKMLSSLQSSQSFAVMFLVTSTSSKNLLNLPFFVSMATAATFVQQIPIFLAYLVPIDVDVVLIKFYQFLFGE
jgi:hypothetical protein